MSTEQFKRRTSALKSPKEIYDKFDQITKSCDTCSKCKIAASRAKISGSRSEVFGELNFIGHGEVSINPQSKLQFLLLYDGTTFLTSAYVVQNRSEGQRENQESWQDVRLAGRFVSNHQVRQATLLQFQHQPRLHFRKTKERMWQGGPFVHAMLQPPSSTSMQCQPGPLTGANNFAITGADNSQQTPRWGPLWAQVPKGNLMTLTFFMKNFLKELQVNPSLNCMLDVYFRNSWPHCSAASSWPHQQLGRGCALFFVRARCLSAGLRS